MVFGFRTFELHNLISLIYVDMLCSTEFFIPARLASQTAGAAGRRMKSGF
jgi:hypothetical protein